MIWLLLLLDHLANRFLHLNEGFGPEGVIHTAHDRFEVLHLMLAVAPPTLDVLRDEVVEFRFLRGLTQ